MPQSNHVVTGPHVSTYRCTRLMPCQIPHPHIIGRGSCTTSTLTIFPYIISIRDEISCQADASERLCGNRTTCIHIQMSQTSPISNPTTPISSEGGHMRPQLWPFSHILTNECDPGVKCQVRLIPQSDRVVTGPHVSTFTCPRLVPCEISRPLYRRKGVI